MDFPQALHAFPQLLPYLFREFFFFSLHCRLNPGNHIRPISALPIQSGISAQTLSFFQIIQLDCHCRSPNIHCKSKTISRKLLFFRNISVKSRLNLYFIFKLSSQTDHQIFLRYCLTGKPPARCQLLFGEKLFIFLFYRKRSLQNLNPALSTSSFASAGSLYSLHLLTKCLKNRSLLKENLFLLLRMFSNHTDLQRFDVTQSTRKIWTTSAVMLRPENSLFRCCQINLTARFQRSEHISLRQFHPQKFSRSCLRKHFPLHLHRNILRRFQPF